MFLRLSAVKKLCVAFMTSGFALSCFINEQNKQHTTITKYDFLILTTSTNLRRIYD